MSGIGYRPSCTWHEDATAAKAYERAASGPFSDCLSVQTRVRLYKMASAAWANVGRMDRAQEDNLKAMQAVKMIESGQWVIPNEMYRC